MQIPEGLLEALLDPHGGRVVLVVGAGCSKEPPTNLELASEYADTAHQNLITDGVIQPDSCGYPHDLSNVADAVWAARGRQRELVERLPRDDFLNAVPNEGYLLAAALLSERAMIGVLSLNFDLAMSHALAQLDIKDVSVIEGPADFGNLGLVNLVYLHRNVPGPALRADEYIAPVARPVKRRPAADDRPHEPPSSRDRGRMPRESRPSLDCS